MPEPALKTKRVIVQLSPELIGEIDKLVSRGIGFRSRTDFIDKAARQLLATRSMAGRHFEKGRRDKSTNRKLKQAQSPGPCD